MAKHLALHTLLALFVLVSNVTAEEGDQEFTAEREKMMTSNKLAVWVVDPLVKVFRNDAPGKQEALEASADVARGEVATLQAVVVSPEPIKNLSARLSDLSVEGKPSLKLTGRVRFVGYVPVTQSIQT